MNRTRRLLLSAVVGLCAATFVIAASDAAAQAVSGPAPDALIPAAQRKPAPDFSVTDLRGQPVTLSADRGKVVLLDFWATWCGGCKLEIPWYIDFYRQYRDRGLAAIGASMDEDGWTSVRPFLARGNDPETGGNIAMPYSVVIATPAMAQRYQIHAMPVTVLIDRKGRIACTHVGVVDRASFASRIQQLLLEH